jgi:predicted DNA-binding protein (MmcQ/YjbR family)
VLTLSVKCEPEVAALLRESYEAVRPGYHLNKRNWNTVTLDGTVAVDDVLDWVDDDWVDDSSARAFSRELAAAGGEETGRAAVGG